MFLYSSSFFVGDACVSFSKVFDFVGECDSTSGVCNDGCEDNFFEQTCDSQCSDNCISIANSSKCYVDNGTCIDGCNVGFTGVYCDHASGELVAFDVSVFHFIVYV